LKKYLLKIKEKKSANLTLAFLKKQLLKIKEKKSANLTPGDATCSEIQGIGLNFTSLQLVYQKRFVYSPPSKAKQTAQAAFGYLH